VRFFSCAEAHFFLHAELRRKNGIAASGFFEKGWLSQEKGCASQVNYHQKATSRLHPQKHYMHAIASSVQETATREKQFPRVFQVPLNFSSRNSNYYKKQPKFPQ
jgi:hypothetical protein